MKASDFLAAITVELFETPFQEVCFQEGEQLLAVTDIHLDQDQLILYRTGGQSALSMKELVLQLMLNRKAYLFFYRDGELQPVYGFREESGKLVI